MARRSDQMSGVDRISNLPWDVLDTILVRIPLKEAARTSVLSSKWRHHWARMSRLVVDDVALSGAPLDKRSRWRVIENILHQARTRNTCGPIEEFKLAAFCQPDHSVLVSWLGFLFGRGLKELVVKPFSSPSHVDLPLREYCCRQLSRLELYGCAIDIPRDCAFVGFESLKTLELSSASIDSVSLEHLIQRCPNLERLVLLELEHVVFARLHNTKLRYLRVSTGFDDICLMNNLFLETVDIRLSGSNSWSLMAVEDVRLLRIIGCLQALQRLTLTNEVLQFLAEKNVPDRLPCLLENLKVLELREVQSDNLKLVKVSLCLLKSSPNLEELYISVCESFGPWKPVVDFMKEQVSERLDFNRLRVLVLRGAFNLPLSMHFIMHVLANSPLLETLTVVRYNEERVPEEVFDQYERVSPRVKILSLASTF